METERITKNKVIGGLAWKFGERIAAQGAGFIISMFLARLLTPEDYGLVSLIYVFIAVSNVFIESGFGSALMQKKNPDDLDFTSVFLFNVVASIFFYIVLFFAAPYIALFYDNQQLILILRILGISIIISGVNNVQRAYVSKTMQFKRFFYSTFIGTVLSGMIGIYLAFHGAGVWALVVQQLTNLTINTFVLWFTVKWRPIAKFSFVRLKELYSFGWKLLVSSFIDTIYNNMYSLIIGKIYDSASLGLYNKGYQFPNLIIANVNTPIQSVMLPALSAEQDNKERCKYMVRRSIVTSSFIIFPMLIGLAAVGKSLVIILLTDKWIDCVPFLQISCITLAFWPIHTANLQAINALGRSDIFLKLEVLKKVIGISIWAISIPFGLYAMVIGKAVSSFISSIINAFPNKKLLNYSYLEQIKDIVPSLLLAGLMGVIVKSIELLKLNLYVTFGVQIIVGIVIYIGLAYLLKMECLKYLLSIIKIKRF